MPSVRGRFHLRFGLRLSLCVGLAPAGAGPGPGPLVRQGKHLKEGVGQKGSELVVIRHGLGIRRDPDLEVIRPAGPPCPGSGDASVETSSNATAPTPSTSACCALNSITAHPRRDLLGVPEDRIGGTHSPGERACGGFGRLGREHGEPPGVGYLYRSGRNRSFHTKQVSYPPGAGSLIIPKSLLLLRKIRPWKRFPRGTRAKCAGRRRAVPRLCKICTSPFRDTRWWRAPGAPPGNGSL